MRLQDYHQSRRNFLKNTAITGAFLPFVHGNLLATDPIPSQERLKVYIFSKHLQFLDYNELAQAAVDMGFDGVDLSVRPKGHVLPERVEEDLPKAVEAFRKAGFAPLLMTTAVEDAHDKKDKTVLDTASKLGFKYYRMNWYAYPQDGSMPEALERLGQKVKELGALNKELGLTGYYQNHAGTLVGASVWEIAELLKHVDTRYMGVQYDIRHAMVEGFASWPNGLRRVQSQIRSLTIKDFKWQQQNGVWTVQDTPMGEGLIDFNNYFKLLKKYKINVPVSLHIEYPLGGVEHGNTKITIDKQEVFKAMKKDLQKVHELWQQA